MEGVLFRDQYPRIFVVAQQEDAKICDLVIELEEQEKIWKVLVLRNLSDWEVDEYLKLLRTLSLVSMDGTNDSP